MNLYLDDSLGIYIPRTLLFSGKQRTEKFFVLGGINKEQIYLTYHY
jgi:hypothetical protein